MPPRNIEIFQTGASLNRLHTLFDLNFLQLPNNIQSPFYKSVFVECVIELHYLLRRDDFKSILPTINFNDDIPFFQPKGRGTKDGYNDIVTLVAFFRDAICHSEAHDKRRNDQDKYVSYIFQSGSAPSSFTEIAHLCKYDDDIACVFGKHIIYIKRHLLKIFYVLSEQAYKMPQYKIYKRLLDLKEK